MNAQKGRETRPHEDGPPPSYEVGYCRPPIEHRFKKGASSPNPKGRCKKVQQVDLGKLLREPVLVTVNGEKKLMDPFEAELRSLVRQARSGNMAAADEFLLQCERYGLFQIIEEEDEYQCVYVLTEWDYGEWLKMYNEHGLPPWPGEWDGLVSPERLASFNAG